MYIYILAYVCIYNCIMSISNPQLNGIKETITRYYKIFSRYFLKTNLSLKIYVLLLKKT